MSEKVLHEVQIVETEDGFRIELKGDKEMLRRMLFEQRRPPFMPFGWWHGFGGHGAGGHHGRPPFARQEREERHERKRHLGGRWEARWGYDMGPWWDESAAPDEETPANT
jgi:hypothetical protein